MSNDELIKEQLLKTLYTLGIHESGRKIRSDSGHERGPNSHVRSDVGSARNTRGIKQEPLTIYMKLRSRLLSNLDNSQLVIEPDINHIFMPAKRESKIEHGNFTIIHHGVKIFRRVRHIKGYEVSLEKYRFNALQSKILHGEILPHQKPAFKYELSLFSNVTTWLELFCSLYHVNEQDALKWTFDKWWNDYIVVCDEELSDEFKFNIKYSPGTPEFLPEYAERVIEIKNEKIQKVISSKAYENEYARVRDLYTAKEHERIKVDILALPDSEQYTMVQLDKIVKKQIDNNLIQRQINEHMDKWLEDKIINN